MKKIITILSLIVSTYIYAKESNEVQRASLFNLARDFAHCSAIYDYMSVSGGGTELEAQQAKNLGDNARTVSAFIFQTIETGKRKTMLEYNELVDAFISAEKSAIQSLMNKGDEKAVVSRAKKCALMNELQTSILNDIQQHRRNSDN